MKRGRLAICALVWMTVGCGDGVGPDVGRVAIEPPAPYAEIWSEIESCAGIQGSFGAVRWFVVHEFSQGMGILAQWNARREITVRSDVWLERGVVGHESLHDLLQGDADHRRPEWDQCGLDRGLPEG